MPPRGFIQTYWPVLTTLGIVMVSAVRADSRINETQTKVEYLYNQGSPSVTPRLARIEATQEAMKAQLDRIETKLDEKEAR